MNAKLSRPAALCATVIALAACGSEATDNSVTTPTQTTSMSSAPSTPAASSTTDSTSADPSSSSPLSTTSAAQSSTPAASPTSSETSSTETSPGSTGSAATRTILLNPKASDGSVARGWAITQGSGDPCMGFKDLEPSGYAVGKNVFACGPMAAAILACWTFPGDKVGCMHTSDDPGRKLVMYNRAGIGYAGAAEPNPSPLAVELKGGTVCSAAMHDQAQHWQGRQGWLYCKDGRMLLTSGKNGEGDYFDKGTPAWTADAAPQNGVVAPKKVQVTSVTYAQGD